MFWGNSAHSNRVFNIQKGIIRIMAGIGKRDSCRKLFSHLNILPLPSLYILASLRFVMKNKEFFTTNNEIHQYGTRQTHYLHFPPVNLKKYQSAVYCMGIETYNCLPPYIKAEFNNIIKFEYLFKKFLRENTFYSLYEFFNFEERSVTNNLFVFMRTVCIYVHCVYLCTLCVFINHASYYNLDYIKQFFFITLIKLYSL